MTYRFTEAADREFREAILWYDEQRSGLGRRFAEAVDAGIAVVLTGPERWPEVRSRLRKYLVHRFPYCLYYRVDGGEVEIVAVANLRRRPGYWLDRS